MVYGMYVSVGFLLVPVDPAIFWCEAERLLGDVRPPPHHHRPPLLLLDLQPHQVDTNYGLVYRIGTGFGNNEALQMRCSCPHRSRLCRRLPRSRQALPLCKVRPVLKLSDSPRYYGFKIWILWFQNLNIMVLKFEYYDFKIGILWFQNLNIVVSKFYYLLLTMNQCIFSSIPSIN